MKYNLRFDIPIEACDDIEARDKANKITSMFELMILVSEKTKCKVKLQKIEDNKLPRGLKLLKGGNRELETQTKDKWK